MSRPPFREGQIIDTLGLRGNLRKENIVRIRSIVGTDTTNSIFFICLQKHANISSVPSVHIYVDSIEAFGDYGFYGPGKGMMSVFPPQFHWNYDIDPKGNVPRSRIEKKATVSVFDIDGNEILHQNAGIRVSANASVNFFNKALAVVAREQYGPKKFQTDLYHHPGNNEKYKWLKFRVGGTAQQNGISGHEIVMSAINGLGIGDIPVTPVEVFLNGSYWSFAFMQDKVSKHSVAKSIGVDDDSISMASLNGVMLIDEQTANSFVAAGLDTAEAIFFKKNNLSYSLNLVEEGDARSIEHFVEKVVPLIDAVIPYDGRKCYIKPQQGDYFQYIDSIVDMKKFAYYFATVEFFELRDAMANNVDWVVVSKIKPFPVARDFDVSMENAIDSYWHLLRYDTASHENYSLTKLISEVLLQSPSGREYLALAYQDLLNTAFSSSRLMQISSNFAEIVDQKYPEMYNSWGGWPNGGIEPVLQTNRSQQFVDFSVHRQNFALQNLADYLIPGNLDIADMHTVRVVMDSLPLNSGVIVKLNTLTIDTTWQGQYFPLPALQVSASVPDGYTLSWKEYTDSATVFRPKADSTITITPVLTPKSVGASALAVSQGFEIFPNPSSGRFYISGSHDDMLQVTDIAGRFVKSLPKGVREFELPEGVYFVTTLNILSTPKKLVVQ